MELTDERPSTQARAKVSGRARYAADVHRPGTLYGAVLRSPLPHARIVSIDTSAARAVEGVRGVIVGDDFPVDARLGRAIRDMPPLARDKVRFAGEKVAAVAADTEELAQHAVGLIDVEYDPLPAVFDPLEAVHPDAPAIHDPELVRSWAAPRQVVPIDHPNGVSRLTWGASAREVDAALADCPVVVTHTFRTPVQHQGYLEPHACTVEVDARGEIHVWASNKAPFLLSSYLHAGLGLDPARLRVHVLPLGGDFGGKGSWMDIPLAYLLAERTRRPVRFIMSYTDELTAGNPRHSAVIEVRSGVDGDGRIRARLVRIWFASGGYAAFKPSPDAALPNIRAGATGPYEIPVLRIEAEVVYTNTVPSGHMRNPGQAQPAYAIECHTDLLARELGRDPVELRRQNATRAARRTRDGSNVPNRIRELLTVAEQAIGHGEERPPGIGRGVALGELHASPGVYSGALRLSPDGAVTFRTPLVDNGAGVVDAFRILIANRLSVPVDDVRILQSTAGFEVDRGIGGSRVTRMVGTLIGELCERLIRRLSAHLQRRLSQRPAFEDGNMRLPDGRRLTLGQAAALHGRAVTVRQVYVAGERDTISIHAVQAVEVHVDRETGAVRPTRIVSVHEAGQILHRRAFESQVEGAAIQGLGFALMEGLTIDDGVVAAVNLHDYKIPTAQDAPPIEIVVRTDPRLGLTPIGEGTPGLAPAVANAVMDAIGAGGFDLPLTPEQVLKRTEEVRRDR